MLNEWLLQKPNYIMQCNAIKLVKSQNQYFKETIMIIGADISYALLGLTQGFIAVLAVSQNLMYFQYAAAY